LQQLNILSRKQSKYGVYGRPYV